MAKGAFRVSPNQEDPRDILFSRADGDGQVPADQLELRDAIEQTLLVLRTMFPEQDRRFVEYYRPLLSLSQAGLVGDAASPEISQRALMSLRAEISAREGGRIKNQYMKALLWRAAILSVLFFTVAAILHFVPPHATVLSNFFVLLGGSMLGVWVSFGARKTILRFEELHILEEDRLEPFIRLVFAGLLTVIIGLLFGLKAVAVTIGAVTTDRLMTEWPVALLIGMLCGFSEQALSTTVAKHASTLFSTNK
jgi:hypothetical protein